MHLERVSTGRGSDRGPSGMHLESVSTGSGSDRVKWDLEATGSKRDCTWKGSVPGAVATGSKWDLEATGPKRDRTWKGSVPGAVATGSTIRHQYQGLLRQAGI